MEIKKCHVCGQEIKEGAKFCLNCGTEVVETMICVKCGASFDKRSDICDKCGEPNPNKNIHICSNCGQLVYGDEKICTHCSCANPNYEGNEQMYHCPKCGKDYAMNLEKCPDCSQANEEYEKNRGAITEETNRRRKASEKSFQLRSVNEIKANVADTKKAISEEVSGFKKQFSNEKVNCKEIIDEAKEKVKGRRGKLLLGCWFKSIMLTILNIIPFGSFLLLGPVTTACDKIFTDLAHGHEVKEKDIFINLKDNIKNKFGATFYAVIKRALYFVIPMLVCAVGFIILYGIAYLIVKIASNSRGFDYKLAEVLFTIAYILAAIPTIVVFGVCWIRTTMVYHELNDSDTMDGDEALRLSVELMKHRELEYLLLKIRLIPEYIKCIFFEYGEPVIEEAKAIYYETIKEQSQE